MEAHEAKNFTRRSSVKKKRQDKITQRPLQSAAEKKIHIEWLQPLSPSYATSILRSRLVAQRHQMMMMMMIEAEMAG